jgi:site-specific DNA-methyltransferase (adenine-specific)
MTLHEPNTIHCVDCMDGLKEMPDNYIGLAIVDPPYGIGDFSQGSRKPNRKQYNKTWDVLWNEKPPDEEYFAALIRVSKRQIIWGSNYYPRNYSPGCVVWYKRNMSGFGSECEIASVSGQKRVVFVEIPWTGTDKHNTGEATIHPCQKPIALYKWLLKNYAKEGDLILDTHMGSGSSYIAALDMGFDYIGYEIDEDYFEAIEKRVYQFTRQTALI